MGLRINSNPASTTAPTSSPTTTEQPKVKAQRLSASLRIPSAEDDATCLATSELRRSELRLADEATRNADDAIPLIQAGLEALNGACANQTSPSGQRASEGNTTVGHNDLSRENREFTDLIDAIDAFSQSATSMMLRS